MWCSIGDESPGLYVPEDDMSASKSPNVCCKFENFEHNQTRLKLKARVSTLYIQVEECLSVSCYHHTAGGEEGNVVPFEAVLRVAGSYQIYLYAVRDILTA